ncbi:hypothetical protein ACFWHW_03615 [Streptomyces pharetrae]|uniref:hypothetical protein n=1 Tax=Streptomyces pharetrae TaxID=291370 RepID=UPI0036619AA8
MAESYPALAAGQRITASLLRSMLPQVARKTADTSRSATTTLADDLHLTWTVDAGGVYMIDGWIKFDGPTAADINIGWTLPTGTDGEWTALGAGLSPVISFNSSGVALTDTVSSRGYTIRSESLDLISNNRTLGTLGVGTGMSALINATIRVGATGGALSFKWAQFTSDASPTTVHTDSTLRLQRVA